MLRQILRPLVLAGSLFALVGCGGPSEYVLTGSSRSAGTDGTLTVEEIEGNRMMTVELEHLPPPSRVSEWSTVYVVWIKPNGGTPSMAGRLDYDEDERTGMMRATTPHSAFEMMITAEADMTVTSPSEVVISRREVGGEE